MTSHPTNSESEIKAAVIGTGFIGPVHVEALRRAGIGVAGILGSTLEKTKRAANELGIGSFSSFDEILADPNIKSVHIATPNRLHYDLATAALNAGKHVLCEKPLAMNSQQTLKLVDLAEQKQLVAAVAYNIRFYPLCHQAADLVQKQQIGKLLHVNGSYTQDWLLKPTDFNWRVLSNDGGELRAVADIGTHWLDLVQFIMGQKITSVFADLRTVYPERQRPLGGSETFTSSGNSENELQNIAIDTEDCGSVLMRFADGAQGCLWVSQMTAGRKNCLRFEIGGSQCSMAWNSENPNELCIGKRDAANEVLIRDPSLMTESASRIANYPGGHNEGFPDTFKQLFKSFYKYIQLGDYAATPTFPTFADGHYEVMLCEAILRSHREQRWVNMGEN